MRRTTLALILAAPALLLAGPETKTLPPQIQAESWVTTLREEKLSWQVEAEIFCRDQPLDEVINLLAGSLPGDSTIIFPSQTPMPLVTGRLNGHPLRTIERLLNIHGYTLAERHQVFVVEPAPQNETVQTDSHYLVGPRLIHGDVNRLSLEGVLDKARHLLAIPEMAECRITDHEGRTIGWQQNNTLLAKRVRYETADNGFLFSGTSQEHRWFEAVLQAVNRDVTPLVLSFQGHEGEFRLQTRRLYSAGAQTRQFVTFERNLWKLKSERNAMVPVSSQRTGPIDVGDILTFWVEDLQNGMLTVHLENRDDDVTNGFLSRSFKASTLQVASGEPFEIRIGETPHSLVIRTASLYRPPAFNAKQELSEVKARLSSFAPVKKIR